MYSKSHVATSTEPALVLSPLFEQMLLALAQKHRLQLLLKIQQEAGFFIAELRPQLAKNYAATLARQLRLSRSTLSHHLRKLEQVGLIREQRIGHKKYIFLHEQNWPKLLRQFSHFFPESPTQSFHTFASFLLPPSYQLSILSTKLREFCSKKYQLSGPATSRASGQFLYLVSFTAEIRFLLSYQPQTRHLDMRYPLHISNKGIAQLRKFQQQFTEFIGRENQALPAEP